MANNNLIKKFHFIYKTINLINNDFYIGMHSTNNLNDKYIGSGKRLRFAIRKYGVENFICDILEFLPDRESLIKKEIEIINKELLLDSKCLNLMIGGEGGFISKENQAFRSKCGGLAAAKTGLNQKTLKFLRENDTEWFENFKKKISDSKIGNKVWLGRHHSNETKEKISNKKKGLCGGEKHSQYNTCWITNGEENKKMSKNNVIPEGWRMGRAKIGKVGNNQYTK